MHLGLFLVLAAAGDIATGPWRGVIVGPHGDVPFVFDVSQREGAHVARIRNGAEVVERPFDADGDGDVRIEFPHYDSALSARVDETGRALDGRWVRIGTDGQERVVPFAARAGSAPRFATGAGATADAARVAGRWTLRFEGNPEPAVLVLESVSGEARGTVLTSTGDHRFLAGTFAEGTLRLSCFDGAHAYLHEARLLDDGTLAGRFASASGSLRDWTARRDANAAIGDEYARSRWSESPGLLWIEGLDAGGERRSLGDELRGRRALVVQVAGSWCPNCHDELAWLAPLAVELAPRGLATVTLGFESDADPARALRQLARMRDRHGASHAFLLAGTPDRAAAAQALGAIDRVVAFPTLVILSGDGTPVGVHAGFRGPAAGGEHEAAVREMRERVEAALAREVTPSAALEMLVAEGLWRDERDRTLVDVQRVGGSVTFVERELFRFDGPTRAEPVAEGEVSAQGDVVWIGAEAWQFDRRAQVALDPRDLAHRLVPAARGPFPRVGDGTTPGESVSEPERILAGLESSDAVVRRESAWFLAAQIVAKQFAPPDYAPNVDPSSAGALVPLLADPDSLVRATATWAAGLLRVPGAEDALRENARHPFAAVRREARKALAPTEPR